jgi:hypothetical protein
MDSGDKVAVVLTREQVAHAAAIIDLALSEDRDGDCDCCRATVAALEAALKE